MKEKSSTRNMGEIIEIDPLSKSRQEDDTFKKKNSGYRIMDRKTDKLVE